MPNLSNLQMIQELCGIVEGLARLVDKQADALAQMGAVVCEEERATLSARYTRFLGGGEIPGEFIREEEKQT